MTAGVETWMGPTLKTDVSCVGCFFSCVVCSDLENSMSLVDVLGGFWFRMILENKLKPGGKGFQFASIKQRVPLRAWFPSE